MFYPTTQFHFMIVESAELKKEIHRLRYQVYVEECGFEHPEDHPYGLETDPYDISSLHLGAFDDKGELVGTCRIVLPSPQGLPIEHAVSFQANTKRPPQETTGEISRLVISRSYRRRIEDGLYGLESYCQCSPHHLSPQQVMIQEKRKRPVIILGLFRLLYLVSKKAGLTHWYMIAEKRLWSMLQRYNLLFSQIAEPIEYHGIRIPYLGDIAAMEEHLRQTNLEFFQTFVADVKESVSPALVS